MFFLNRIYSTLTHEGVRYTLVGGHAVALHGSVHGTVHVDIGLVSRLPVTADDVFQFRDDYVQNRNLVVWNFYNPDNLAEQAATI